MFDGAGPIARPVRLLAIECQGRRWAVVRFSARLDVARGCGIEERDGVSYLIGVSHARLWFVANGQAVEPVRSGFGFAGIEMNIVPWETPADALRRQAVVTRRQSAPSG